MKTNPELVVEYTDPLEGFKGWLVIDSLTHRLCAGGMRVQKGLTCGDVKRLAATMTLKMRVAGIKADGAKSGIDYDPSAPGKEQALSRFIGAIKPYICGRYSMGPDLNTTMPELDSICQGHGISSIKIAVAKAQELHNNDFKQRLNVLSQTVGHATLGRLRSGAGLAASCLAVLDHLGIETTEATVAIQGFGGLAAGAAFFLHQAGVKIIALADKTRTLVGLKNDPLDIETLLAGAENGLIPDIPGGSTSAASQKIFTVPCDVLIPAAIERAIDLNVASSLLVKAVVCGANLAVTAEAETILYERDIILIPDLVAGCGGSLSMEGLFGPVTTPSVTQVLDHVDSRSRWIVRRLLKRSAERNIAPREAALEICAETPLYPDSLPYEPLGESD